MKALRIYKDAVVNLEEVCEPEVGINDVTIKVIACGICGSDIPRVLNNKAHYYPIILGHEISGVVSDIGINVKDICVGDHVVVAPLLPCFKCDDCINGNYSLCKYYSFIGSRTQGGMAEYISVPQNNVIKINKNIDLHNAALIEPLTVALHGFKQNNYIFGGKVAILGMGTIGCFCAQIARIKGAKNITAFVRNDKYNELALELVLIILLTLVLVIGRVN